MIGFILGLLAVIAVVVAIVLCVVILLQEPKGGGLAAALGGSGMEAIGVNTGSVNKFTATLATIWVIACFAHAVLLPMGAGVSTDGTQPDTPELPVKDGGGDDK